MLTPLVGVAMFFLLPWWAAVLTIFVGVVIIRPAVQKSAAQHVLEYALEDESFYSAMTAQNIITTTQR